ncbi:dephospho-CoA kinase [Lapillicoccus jejuensis]|uniref:Dephospho-CoA kinase n=1 Tax=Lapillicoccus jejuensis TaxID=402171 RepID=A0A542E446_9MICO|nr:dephospho-CoA kinase [Lapillicoccus jejuensis]TQJ10085.1 dephospho-CoA kinase [Lapillicoccus jejuensis]
MLRVGLTGGIGAGKSTVARRLEELGAVVTDADAVAREVMEPGEPTLAAVAERFGAHLLRADGTLDRAALAAVVFPDPAALADLDAITGPAIAQRVAARRAQVPADRVSVFDMPLLVERRLWVHEHLTLVVDAPVGTRVRRLVEQRGLDEGDARHRIAAQADDRQRRAAADLWVDNGGDPDATREQVDALWRDRLAPYDDALRTGRRSRRPEHGPILHEPDPTWPAQAARLVARLHDALDPVVPGVRVDHIGSTSVPGLPAKDVLDLQVGVPDLALADTPVFRGAMDGRGFVRSEGNEVDHPHGPDPWWEKRFHGSVDPGRSANVHVRAVGSPGWTFALAFRDRLRADDAWRAEYAAVKARLAREATSTTAYVDAKEPWFEPAWHAVQDWVVATGWRPPPEPTGLT